MNQREQLFCRLACQDTVCHHGLFSFEDHSRHHCSVGSRVAPSLTCTIDMTTAWLLCDTIIANIIIANIINTMACRQLLQHRQTPAFQPVCLSLLAWASSQAWLTHDDTYSDIYRIHTNF